jgi:hypothetical protein
MGTLNITSPKQGLYRDQFILFERFTKVNFTWEMKDVKIMPSKILLQYFPPLGRNGIALFGGTEERTNAERWKDVGTVRGNSTFFTMEVTLPDGEGYRFRFLDNDCKLNFKPGRLAPTYTDYVRIYTAKTVVLIDGGSQRYEVSLLLVVVMIALTLVY